MSNEQFDSLTEADMIAWLVLHGTSLTYLNKLTICDLDRVRSGSFRHRKRPSFQVHSDAAKVPHSKLYRNLDEAVTDYLRLKREIR